MTNSWSRTDDILLTTSARTCLPLARDAVWPIIEALTNELWPSRVIVAQRPALLVQAVGADTADDPDGWLSWTLDDLSPEDTRVTVSLSEPCDGAPEPELDLLLCRLVARAVRPDDGPAVQPLQGRGSM